MIASEPFVTTCAYPVRTLDELDFYIDGEDAFIAIAEAIEKARSYVYMTCAYSSLNFRLRPPASEQLRELCHRTSQRGVRVAMLFWQPLNVDGSPNFSMAGTVSQADLPELTMHAPKVMARWDAAKTDGTYPPLLGCHHQKTFVIDGVQAFVGGINMTQDYWDTCSHVVNDDRRVSYDVVDPAVRKASAGAATTLPLHDLFARLSGAAVADVEANFVERWNGATSRLTGPDLVARPASSAFTLGNRIQILRTTAPQTYVQTAAGETSIKQAMLNVLRTAERSVYFENQYFFDDDIVAALRAAGERGVRTVGLLARCPDAAQFVGVLEHCMEAHWESVFQWTHSNPRLHENIELYSPVTTEISHSKDIYVHSKTMIVDDRYIIVGSANISFTSLDFHSEMCVLADDPNRAKTLRKRLWAEHLCGRPDTIPDDFVAGAAVWHQHGAKNEADRGHRVLGSRVLPLRAPRVGADVPQMLEGDSSREDLF